MADYKTEHQSAGFSTGGSIGSQFAGNMANTLLTGGNTSGHDEGTTRSAVSDGTIVVRNGADQRQDVNDLSRDVEHANGSIGQIFDKEKEQKRLEQAQMIGEIGRQVMDIARAEGDIAALNASRKELAENKVFEPGPDATQEKRDEYTKALTETSSYKTVQKQWGTGSAIQQGIQAATAAVPGLAADLISSLYPGTDIGGRSTDLSLKKCVELKLGCLQESPFIMTFNLLKVIAGSRFSRCPRVNQS